MTLSTNVYVLDRVNHLEVFRLCQSLLTPYDTDRRGPEQQQWSNESTSAWRGDGAWCISNAIGQGLPAILDITYRPDGPLRTPEQVAECDEDCDPDCDKDHYRRACWLDIDFDTSYGAEFGGNMGCGDLHATLVAELGKWLDGRGVRWEWRNEFTGEIHGGSDRFERLIDLVSDGFAATAWLQTMVLPAIELGAFDGLDPR